MSFAHVARTLGTVGIAVTFAVAGSVAPAHADDARLDVIGWNLPATKVGSAACRSMPVQAKVRKATDMTLSSVVGDVMFGTRVAGGFYALGDGRDSFQFCPTYDTFGAYTFGPTSVSGWSTDTYDEVDTTDTTRGVLWIRRNSIVTVSTARVGKYVTVKSTAKRFVIANYSTGKYAPWPNAVAYVQVKSGTKWVTKKAVRTNSQGAISAKVYAPTKQVWRVSYATTNDTMGIPTATSTR